MNVKLKSFQEEFLEGITKFYEDEGQYEDKITEAEDREIERTIQEEIQGEEIERAIEGIEYNLKYKKSKKSNTIKRGWGRA